MEHLGEDLSFLTVFGTRNRQRRVQSIYTSDFVLSKTNQIAVSNFR